MKKSREEYYSIVQPWSNQEGMCISVEKNCEANPPLYKIILADLTTWQTKEDLVRWLRRVAEEVEKVS